MKDVNKLRDVNINILNKETKMYLMKRQFIKNQ